MSVVTVRSGVLWQSQGRAASGGAVQSLKGGILEEESRKFLYIK